MSLDEGDVQPFEFWFTVKTDGEEVETFDHWDNVLIAGQGDGCPRRAIGREAAGDDRPMAGTLFAWPEALEGSLIGADYLRVQRIPLGGGAFEADDHPSARVHDEGNNSSVAGDHDPLERHRETFAFSVPFSGFGCGGNRSRLLRIVHRAQRLRRSETGGRVTLVGQRAGMSHEALL